MEFYSKNKFGKLVHLVVFIIRIYNDTRSPEHQILPRGCAKIYIRKLKETGNSLVVYILIFIFCGYQTAFELKG